MALKHTIKFILIMKLLLQSRYRAFPLPHNFPCVPLWSITASSLRPREPSLLEITAFLTASHNLKHTYTLLCLPLFIQQSAMILKFIHIPICTNTSWHFYCWVGFQVFRVCWYIHLLPGLCVISSLRQLWIKLFWTFLCWSFCRHIV